MGIVPDLVRHFVVKHIHSIDVLEILLLLHQDPRKEWGALAITKALQLRRSNVEAHLEHLLFAGLVGGRQVGFERIYQYRPSTVDLARGTDELARWYSSHPVSLISLIFSKPMDRVRTYGDVADEKKRNEQ